LSVHTRGQALIDLCKGWFENAAKPVRDATVEVNRAAPVVVPGDDTKQ